MQKPDAPSCARNRDPILAVLRDHLSDTRQLLEIGSGTGQHAIYFGAALPNLQWQTSELPEHHEGIRAWLVEAALPNVLAPIVFDARETLSLDDGAARYEAVFTSNTLHIMSWDAVQQLFARLPAIVTPGAKLIVYGPFNYHGAYTSDSNRDFDAWLKARDALSGIRDFEFVDALARAAGFALIEDRAMPANNRCIVWQAQTAGR